MIDEDNKTLWCGNLPEQATEELLYELFLQAGPLEKVRIAKDRDGRQKNFGFVTFAHEVSVPYAINLFRGTSLFHRTLSLQCRGRMALLPPPIRCVGPDPGVDFVGQSNVAQQFAEMTQRMPEDDYRVVQMPRTHTPNNDKLVIASLQGNWSHRHHPYKQKDKRDEYRPRDNHYDSHDYQSNSHDYQSNRKNPSNWRDRRSHRKGNHHRRD